LKKASEPYGFGSLSMAFSHGATNVQGSVVESPWNKSARHGEDCRMRCLMNSRVTGSRPYGDGEKNESGKNAAKELRVRFHMHGSGFPCFTNFIVKAYSLTMHVYHCHC